MNKIIALSNNGFQLDLFIDVEEQIHKNKWLTCDKKKVILSGMFSNLRKGLELTDIKFSENAKYVIDFTIVSSSSMSALSSGLNVGTDCLSVDLKKVSRDSSKVPISTSHSTLTIVGGKQVLERDGGVRINSLHIPLKNISSNSKPSSVQELSNKDLLIRYSQCVNIAFNSNEMRDANLTFKGNIELGFEIADKIYKKWNERC